VNANDVLAECEQTGDLLAHRVYHTVHDSPIPLAGSGQVQVQTVPWCPTCHEKPSDYGAPITPGMKDWPPIRLAARNDGSSEGDTP
jgi:hypothetical protein